MNGPYATSTRAARWIASHVWRHKGYVLAFIALAIAGNILLAIIPMLTGAAFDEILGPAPGQGRSQVLVLAILGAVLVRGGTSLLGAGAMEVFAQRLERDARDQFYSTLLRKNLAFHQRQRVGDLMARTTDDVRLLDPMMSPGMAHLFNAVACIVPSIVFAGRISLELLIAPCLFTCGLVAGTVHHVRRFHPIASEVRRQSGALNAEVVQTLSGIELTKWSGQEEQAARRLQRSAERCRDLVVAQADIQARYLPPLLLGLSLAVAVLHGSVLMGRGELSVGNFVAYIGLMTTLRGPTQLLLAAVIAIQEGLAGARRVLAVIDDPIDDEHATSGHRARILGELVFERLSFSYDGATVLNDISFRVAPGETVALVGPAGAGKTTLSRLINRTYDVGEGRILIDGVDVRAWAFDSLRTQIAVVEQDVLLFSDTVRANVGFGLEEEQQRRVEQATERAQAHQFVTALRDGYDTVIGERGVTLSGGQRQRLALARALAIDPAVLILDDATSALDSATEDQIQRAMIEVSRSRTTVLITHRLSQIRRADRIVLLIGGHIVDQGSHDELLRRCKPYRRIFGAPVRPTTSALVAGEGGA